MISKFNTFFKLSNSIVKVLNKKESNGLLITFILSIFNTFLELLSITTIIYLLLVISGQNVSESKISSLFNDALPKENIVISSAILMISVVLFKTIFQILFNLFQEKISQNIQNRINNSLYSKFINLNYETYINENSARILRLLSQEAIKIGNQLISPFISIINEVILLFFVSSLIFFYDSYLGFFVLSTSILLILIFTSSISNNIRKLGVDITKNNNHRIKNISETFKSFDLIKIYNSQKLFLKNYENYTQKINRSASMYNFFLKLPKSIFELFIFIFLFSLIVFLYYSGNNDLLISYLSVLAVSVYKVIPSLNKISTSLQTIQYYSSPFKELVTLLDLEEEKLIAQNLQPFQIINYEKFSFSYNNNNKLIFKSIDFRIERNDFIGIFGTSGSGKSTLIKLICGLLKPNKGKFRVDKNEIEPALIHNFFSYVSQEPFIMDKDVRHNISFSFEKEKIDTKKINDVLKQVELYDVFKDKLYDSLGENGIKISGGQKQRVAIARALYFDKQVIILDESTSNLDPKTEKKIINLLKKINNKVTIIFISHKHNSLFECNKLYRIKNNIIEKVK